MKRAWIAFFVTLIVVLPLRIFGMLRYLDPQTGFYSDGGKVVGAATILLIAGGFLTIYFAFRGARREEGLLKPLKNVPAAALGAVAGIFVLVQSVVGLGTDFMKEGRIFYQIFSVAGILTGIVFLMTAYGLATGTRVVGKRPLLALLPSIWGCLFLVVLFITYSAVVNLVEDVYHTFTVAFLLLFLFTQAKLLTGIESTKSGKMIYVVGFPAALLALVTAVPSCVQYFSTGKTAGVISIGLHLSNIILAFYILTFLSALCTAVPAIKERAAAPAESASAAPPRRETPEKPNETENLPEVPRKSGEEDALGAYVSYLAKACGSEKKFVSAGPSPFYTPSESTSEESSIK